MKRKRKMASIFGICLSFLLLGINGNLYAQTALETCVGKEILIISQARDNCRDFEWVTDGGVIEYGKGTGSVNLKFFVPGEKNVRLKYYEGSTVRNQMFTVTVYAKLVFDPINIGTICAGAEFNPDVPIIGGVYFPDSGQWWLDGKLITPGIVLTHADDGKLLSYSVETPYGKVYSEVVSLKVGDRPTILSVNGLPAKISSGSTLHASVDVNDNGSAVTHYAWMLGQDVVAQDVKELDYLVSSKDNDQVMSIKVSNGCGSSLISHIPTSEPKQTPINEGLSSTIDTPEQFMIKDYDPDVNAHSLPDKYWENRYYRFYTRDANYQEGSTAWFDYSKSKNGWIPSSQGTGYEFKIYKAPSNLDEVSREDNTTVLLDYRDIYIVNVSTNEYEYFYLFRNSLGFASKSKIFGLKCVLSNGNVDETKKVTIRVTSPDPTSVLPTGMRIQSVSNCVIENVRFDGNGRTFYNYFLDVIDGETGNSNNDYLIMKDINILNVKSKVMTNRPRAIIVFIGHNRRITSHESHIRNQRYIYNLQIEASCQGVPGPGTGLNAAVYVYGSENLYFDRITFAADPISSGFDETLIVARSSDYTLKDSRNIIFKEIVCNYRKIMLSHTYEHRNIVIPADQYRYFCFIPKGIYATGLYAALPAFADTAVIYDRKTGYFLVPEAMATSNFKVLKDLYSAYLNPEIGPSTIEGCPAPNILLIANPATSKINGFTIPDFGIGNVPVNIVAVSSDDYLSGPKQDPAVLWSYNSENPIVFDKTKSNQKVSLYNIDFTGSDYFIDNPWENAVPGTFYNCLMNTHVESDKADDLLKIELGTAIDEFDNTGMHIFAGNGTVEVQSIAEGLIRQIDCFDLQGRLIITKANVDSPVSSVVIPKGNQMVIVKVKTDKQVNVRKLLVNRIY